MRETIRRIIVEDALKEWKSTISWNVSDQHAPYNIAEVLDVVPRALKFFNAFCKRTGHYPEAHIQEAWIGLALFYLEDRTPERLAELEETSELKMLRSLARQIDTLGWEIGKKSKKAEAFHDKLLELADMLYLIGRGEIEWFEISWPVKTN